MVLGKLCCDLLDPELVCAGGQCKGRFERAVQTIFARRIRQRWNIKACNVGVPYNSSSSAVPAEPTRSPLGKLAFRCIKYSVSFEHKTSRSVPDRAAQLVCTRPSRFANAACAVLARGSLNSTVQGNRSKYSLLQSIFRMSLNMQYADSPREHLMNELTGLVAALAEGMKEKGGAG